MSERIRLGNVYQHEDVGEVLTVHRDYDNTIWFRPVVSTDNAGVISTGQGIFHEDYKDFLGNVDMRDYPDNWEQKAAAIKKRDNYTCQGCGAKESRSQIADDSTDSSEGCGKNEEDDDVELHCHHIVPLGAGGSNARSNLITLCDGCHGRVHGGVT